jgi:type IV pilus assembly protein PilE
MKRNARGFTLMELMVVIVIVAILAAVAVPLYINYVRDAQRTEAKGAIGAIISAEQVHFQRPENGGNYLVDAADIQAIETGLGLDLTEARQNWTIAITDNGATTDGFKVTATGIDGRPSANLTVTYFHSRDGSGIPATGPWEEH